MLHRSGNRFRCSSIINALRGLTLSETLLQKLQDKTLSKGQLLEQLRKDSALLQGVLVGLESKNASVRYGCGKVLMDYSEEQPGKLYPHMDLFIQLLDSRYRILVWNAMAIIANLTRVDADGKFDRIFEKYYGFLGDEYMVTVASVVGHSAKIARAKPYLTDAIVNKLLSVENIPTTPHLTEECKRVIIEKTIGSLDAFFDRVTQKEVVLAFVHRYTSSPRRTLQREAKTFVEKWTGS
jgi:hypothetical protein